LLFLNCCKEWNFEPEIQELKKWLDKSNPLIPPGYIKVQLASLLSLTQPNDPLLAETLLSERDFPWLTDVILIHRARIANVIGRPNEEKQLIKIFIERQPRLFEPDHAANFGFVKYQETIKPLYKQARRNYS